MNLLSKIEEWGDTHQSKWVDSIRVLLGIVILGKGYLFVKDTDSLIFILESSKFPWVSFAIAHYVAFAHLAGGLLISFGLITRVAVLFQIPILIGAVLFINAQKGFFAVNSELEFSILVLGLLIFFMFYGSGQYSCDELIRKNKARY